LTFPDIENALDDLLAFVEGMQTAGGDLSALANQLPFVDRLIEGGIANVAAVTDAVERIVDRAKTALEGTDDTVAKVVNKLNVLNFGTLPAPLNTLTLVVDALYRVPSTGTGPLELIFNFDLDASVVDYEIPIDLGDFAQNANIELNADLSIDATLEADFAIGLWGMKRPRCRSWFPAVRSTSPSMSARPTTSSGPHSISDSWNWKSPAGRYPLAARSPSI
jgi:hypothetical protein